MQGDGAGAPRDAGWIKTNRGVASCIAGVAILLLVYLALSEWAYRELRDGFRLGFFTSVSVVAMLACAVAMMIDRHRGETEEDIAPVTWRDWLVVFVVVALCYLYFQLAWTLDFLLVTPVFLAGATFWLGVRPLRAAIIAGLSITAVIYGLFRLIGIELPSTILGF